jgi:hypothetical protein
MRTLFLIGGILLAALNLHAANLDATLIRASGDLEQTDAELAKLKPKLKKLFGYEHYRQLGHSAEPLVLDQRKRLNLSKGFTVFVTHRADSKKTHTVDLEWYSGKAAIVKSTIKLTEGSPVLIKGPEVGKDWIILALTAAP